MARKDALLRLHQRLLSQRDALRKKLAAELKVSLPPSWDGARDVGDVANEGAEAELDSQLAALESRELGQIEQAIENIRDGRYGLCEMCDKPIPIERLRALPFTTHCIACQRHAEIHRRNNGIDEADWESAYEHEGRLNDRELTLGDIDIEAAS
jgi:RNA polymerase-binding transcription factor